MSTAASLDVPHDQGSPASPAASMPPQSATTRRPRPGNVQTGLASMSSSQLNVIPASAISASSVASSSHCSPMMSPETVGMTTGSSIVPSPEPLRGREQDQFYSPGFQLPEPVLLNRRTSSNSLHQPLVPPGTTAMQDAVRSSPGVIRRLSNRATRKASSVVKGRRTSSAQPNSRDTSVGPGILRRRSDSTNTAPTSDIGNLHHPFDTDSDLECADEKDGFISVCTYDGVAAECSPISAPTSAAASMCPSSSTQAGPVIPLNLLRGTSLRKISKKNNAKRIMLVLEPDAGKITWDKTRSSKCVYIDDIKEIRTAEDVKQYCLDFDIKGDVAPRFFSILYAIPDRSQHKTMHLIADDDETFSHWTETLDAMYKHRHASMESLMAFNDKAVRAYWEREMNRRNAGKPPSLDDGEIDFPGVERVCRNLHIHVSQETLRANFNQADSTRSGSLNFNEFQEFVRLMKKREDIQAIYREIASGPDGGVTREAFFSFLRDVQCENVDDDLAHWDAVFAGFTPRRKAKTFENVDASDVEVPRMSEAGLAAFLTSTYNLAIRKAPQEYTLDRPMNEYFISSSHNTYLLGRQVVGTSSIEGYISALMRGCRCVEIDCWDGSDGQPEVLHGRAFTTKISFEQVIHVINKYAFVKSNFPLWISLEVHCNAEQQKIMARTMRDVFGSKLITEPLSTNLNQLPSPSQLLGRILVKAKKPRKAEDGNAGRRRGNSLNSLTSPYVQPAALDNTTVPTQSLTQSSPVLNPHPVMSRKTSTRSRVDTITEGEVLPEIPSSNTSDCDSGSEKTSGKSKQSNIVAELGDLAVYCMGVKFNGFDDPDCKTYNHILSFVEGTFDRENKPRDAKLAMYRHNMRYLMRVYPAQWRITSTNFNPLTYWRRGVQMAALNWQTYDLGMQLNQAMFDGGTDQSGYVLKPQAFREIKVLLPNAPGQWDHLPGQWDHLKRERKHVNFSIDVISAQQLMRPFSLGEKRTLDPFVEVEVFLPDDKRDKEDQTPPQALSYRTQVIRENGFNPEFQRKFNFNITTKYPELVFVRWTVKIADSAKSNGGATTMATFTAKLSSLKQGYRTIPLLDNNSDRYLFSTLFCRIRIDPITSIYVNRAEDAENAGRLKSIVGRTLNRTNNISPKSSVDSGLS